MFLKLDEIAKKLDQIFLPLEQEGMNGMRLLQLIKLLALFKISQIREGKLIVMKEFMSLLRVFSINLNTIKGVRFFIIKRSQRHRYFHQDLIITYHSLEEMKS